MVASKDDITLLLKLNKSQIQQFGAKSIGLFGSFMTNNQNDSSDIDLLVEFDKDKKNFDNFINLALFLEDLFGRKVELITTESISKYLKPSILNQVEYVNFTL